MFEPKERTSLSLVSSDVFKEPSNCETELNDDTITNQGKINSRTRFRFEEALMIDQELTSTEKIIGLMIVRHYNSSYGYAFPSHKRLAKFANVCVKTSQRAVKSLIAHGWFDCEIGGGCQVGGNRWANEYRPKFDKAIKETSIVSVKI